MGQIAVAEFPQNHSAKRLFPNAIKHKTSNKGLYIFSRTDILVVIETKNNRMKKSVSELLLQRVDVERRRVLQFKISRKEKI